MDRIVSFLVATLFLVDANAEMILRGQCSQLFQPQEQGITVDLADVVFNRYIIRPFLTAKSATDCASKCLSVSSPPCRSAVFEPWNKTCVPLRATRNTALDFDVPKGGAMPLRGMLLAPQSLIDSVADRTNGVPSCSSFCPIPASMTADTITPVCIQDCPNSVAVCAGEEAGCSDYVRKASFYTTTSIRNIGGSTNIYSTTWTKLHDFTSFRLTFNTNWYYRGNEASGWEVIWLTASIGGYNCAGESWDNGMGYDILNIGQFVYFGQPMSAEWICNGRELPNGTYNLVWTVNRAATVASTVTTSVNMAGASSPTFFLAEEFIPARSNFKLDDMARCQSMTVFNTVSKQFSNTFHNAYGLLPYKILKYKKRSDTSILRVYLGVRVEFVGYAKCLHMYVTINDRLCVNPYSIEATIYYSQEWVGSGCRHEQTTKTHHLDGICRNLPAGRYDVQIWLDSSCSGYGGDPNRYWDFDVGSGYPTQMIVEEIYEKIPTNALLLADGSLVSLPNYNRQYFSWNTNCQNGGRCGSNCGGACFNSPFKTFTYSKLQDDSNLHVKWYGGQQFCTDLMYPNQKEGYKWFIAINGVQCSSPSGIEAWWLDWESFHGICQGAPKYVEGICTMPINSGSVTLGLQITWASRNYYPGQLHWSSAGIGGPSYLMVEEIYPQNS